MTLERLAHLFCDVADCNQEWVGASHSANQERHEAKSEGWATTGGSFQGRLHDLCPEHARLCSGGAPLTWRGQSQRADLAVSTPNPEEGM